jgi:hypothetical protein
MDALRFELSMHARAAIGSTTISKDGLDLGRQLLVVLLACAQ